MNSTNVRAVGRFRFPALVGGVAGLGGDSLGRATGGAAWEDVAQDGDFAFLPPRMTSARGEELLRRAFPQIEDRSDVVLVVARPDGNLRPADYALATRLARQFPASQDKRRPIAAVWSCDDPIVGAKLTSHGGRHGQATLVMLKLRTELMAVQNMELLKGIEATLERTRRQSDFPPGLKLGITGSAAVGADMLFAAEESIRNTEWTTVALVVVILLLVYRAGAGAGAAGDDLRLAGAIHRADRPAGAAGPERRVVRLSGLSHHQDIHHRDPFWGRDRLLPVSRCPLPRGVAAGIDAAGGAGAALANVGHVVTASAMTTILGLGTMIFAEFGKYRCGGPTIALSLAVALAACLTLAPALLRAGGQMIFWPLGSRPACF